MKKNEEQKSREKKRGMKKKCKNHWGVKRMKYGYQYGGGGESFLPWSFSRRDQVVINYPETRICMRVDDDRTMKFLSRDKITELSRWFLLSQFYSLFSTLFRPPSSPSIYRYIGARKKGKMKRKLDIWSTIRHRSSSRYFSLYLEDQGDVCRTANDDDDDDNEDYSDQEELFNLSSIPLINRQQ